MVCGYKSGVLIQVSCADTSDTMSSRSDTVSSNTISSKTVSSHTISSNTVSSHSVSKRPCAFGQPRSLLTLWPRGLLTLWARAGPGAQGQ